MRMKKFFFSMMVCLLVVAQVHAQRTVSGKVTDDVGEGLPGVNVVIRGTTNGTTTDLDGNYRLQANDGDVLVYSFVGFETQEINIGTRTTIDVTMGGATELQEVVVVAYGEQTRQSITGSVDVIDEKDLNNVQSGDAIQGLVGRVAGVQIINDNGQPGAAPTVRFRGIGSIGSSSAPLYVVDGVPFYGNINSLAAQDIESISFLKDASANALYGSRGANGVIIITTKKGSNKGLEVTFNAKYGVNDRAVKEYDIITDPGQYYEMWFDRVRIGRMNLLGEDNTTASAAAASGLITGGDAPLGYNIYGAPDNAIIDPSTGRLASGLQQVMTLDNWEDELFNQSSRQEYHLGIRSSGENTSTYFSLGYLDDEGYAINSGFSRISSRLSIDYNATDWLDFGGAFNYAFTDQDAPLATVGSATYSNTFSWVRNVAPIYPIYAHDATTKELLLDADGNRIFDFGEADNGYYGTRPYGAFNNPVATGLADVDNFLTHNITSRFYTKARFLNDFQLELRGSGDIVSGEFTTFATPIGGDAKNANGRLTQGRNNATTLSGQQLLTWDKDFDEHNIKILLGHESTKYKFTYTNAQRTEVAIGTLPVLDNSANFQALRGFEKNYAVEGYFASANYSYRNRYFVNANIRRDGSSVFHPNNRWGTFYGAGIGWIISEESFLSSVDLINNLKLKASIGQNGNDAVLYPFNRTIVGDPDNRNYFPYLNQNQVVNVSGSPGIQFYTLGNPDLQWETNTNINAGFELAMMDNRVSLGFDYWIRKVEDMIFDNPLPISEGRPSFPQNIGSMENKGFDFSITADVVRTNDLTVTLDFNGSMWKNELTELPDEAIDDPNATRFRWQVGKSRYEYYMRRFAGVDETNGDALWYMDVTDASTGEPTGEIVTTNVWNDATEYYIGKTAIPDINGGFGLNVVYKGFDLNVSFAYQMGGYGYDGLYQGLMGSAGDIGQNYHKDVFNTWTPENTSASIPRLDVFDDDQDNFSDYWLVSSDYLSLQNVTLGYSMPEAIVNKASLTNTRLFVTANNVALWSKRQGFDPRLSLTGNGLNEYSVVRAISFGLTTRLK